MRNDGTRRLLPRPGAALGAALLLLAASAEGRDGFYLGAELGLADAATLESSVSGVNHPTRCDRLLYGGNPPAFTATDPVCTDSTPRSLTNNGFELDTGFAAGLAAGWRRGAWRFELEYLHRQHGGETRPLRTPAANTALAGKSAEWAETPTERVSKFRADQLFANVYRDFAGASKWTPYLGAGLGFAETRLRYSNRFLRKSLPEYADIAGTGLTAADRPPAAAGTLSYLDTKVEETLFGFQLLAGADYALAERTSIGAKARWARFEELEEGAVWNQIRDHAPVQADGVTPFTSVQKFDDLEYWAVTIALKRRF